MSENPPFQRIGKSSQLGSSTTQMRFCKNKQDKIKEERRKRMANKMEATNSGQNFPKVEEKRVTEEGTSQES